MGTIELGGRTGQEVYKELKHRLEGMGYLPDEYLLLDADWENGKMIPKGADISPPSPGVSSLPERPPEE